MFAIRIDCSDSRSVREAFEGVLSLGFVEVLIYNANQQVSRQPTRFIDVRIDSFEKSLAVSSVGAFHCSQQVHTHTHKSPSLLPHFHFLHFPRKIKRKWALELCVKTNFNLFWEIVGYSGDGGKRKRYNSLYRLLSFFEWRCWFLWPLWVLHSKHSLSVFLLRFTMFLYIIRPLQSINLQNPVIIIVKLEKEIGVEICFDLG